MSQHRRGYFTLLAAITTVGVSISQAQAPWMDDQAVQRELAAREVAVRFSYEGDESRMRVHAAVRVNASPDAIWRVLTDCDHAANFVPGVKRCRRVQTAPDGKWEVIEQEAKYSWIMPSITTVVRLDYQRPQRIDFKRVSGDLKAEEGEWLLRPESNATAGQSHETLLEYELYVDPGFWIPRVLVRHSLRTELPAALSALRARSESSASDH